MSTDKAENNKAENNHVGTAVFGCPASKASPSATAAGSKATGWSRPSRPALNGQDFEPGFSPRDPSCRHKTKKPAPPPPAVETPVPPFPHEDEGVKLSDQTLRS